MSEIVSQFSVSVDQIEDYEFRVKFHKEQMPDLLLDEPPPLGHDRGPSASRLLAAAIGNCLSASLLFCARKGRVELGPIHTEVSVNVVRNQDRRLRIGKVDVVIDPRIPDGEKEKAQRCLGLFEDFCTVTESVRGGIDVAVHVEGLDGGNLR